MARKMKRLLSLILALSMCMSMAGFQVFAADDNLVCTKAEHEHGETCYQTVLSCEKHVHGEGCEDPCGLEAAMDLICTKEVHEHSDECAHTHGDACKTLNCTVQYDCTEEHEHTEECTVHSHVDACYTLTCEKTMDCTKEVHVHDAACYELHAHGDDCYVSNLICTIAEHTHSIANDCYCVAMIGETKYTSLAKAIEAANKATETEITITLVHDAEIGATQTIKKDITIEGEYTINWTNIKKSMFTISSGAELTLDGGVVIECGNEWELDEDLYDYYLQNPYAADGLNRLVNLDPDGIDMYPITSENGKNDFGATAHLINNNGTLNMDEVTIQNFYSFSLYRNKSGDNKLYTSDDYSCSDGKNLIVAGKNSVTNLNDGAVFQHNASGNGGLIVNASSAKAVNVDGAEVKDNYAGQNGGMFKIYYTPMNLKDGYIHDNMGSNCNGVVVMLFGAGSQLNMSGGEICSNSAVRGYTNGFNSSVYLHNKSEMYMTGGRICCNVGCQGGGIYAKYPDNCFLDITFGYVIDNVSVSGTGYHDVGGQWVSDDDYWGNREDLAKVWGIKGGVYTQDVSKWCNPFNYICVPYAGSTDKDDDFIVTVGYNVKYYELIENEDGTISTTLLHTEKVLVNEGEAIDPKGYAYYPAQSGCAIQNWFLDKELKNEYDFSTPIEGPTNLYGMWIDVPVVDFMVTDKLTGEKIPNEDVTIIVKDSDGNVIDAASNDPNAFVLEDGETYTYEIVADGYKTVTGTFDVAGDATIEVEMAPISIITFETDPETARVQVRDSDGRVVDPIDRNGKVYELLDGEEYTYYVYESGYDSETGSIIPVDDETIAVKLNKKSNNNNNNNGSSGGGNSGTDIVDEDVPLGLNTGDHFQYIVGDTNGLVRPLSKITRAEVAAIFYRLLDEPTRTAFYAETCNLPDVTASKWYNEEVCTLVNAGILTGCDDGLFHGERNITRGELATITAKFDATVYVGPDKFDDIASHWAREYINISAENGWIVGNGTGKFRPYDDITRAEVMTIVNAVLRREVDEEGLIAGYKAWPDNLPGTWYYYQVIEATNYHDYEYREDMIENWTEILPDKIW